jgi:hypothetical protein
MEVKDLEVVLTNVINSAFNSVSSTWMAFDLEEAFNDIATRESVRSRSLPLRLFEPKLQSRVSYRRVKRGPVIRATKRRRRSRIADTARGEVGERRC